MTRALMILAGAAYFSLVFTITLYLTFPSDPVAKFLAHSVEAWSGGAYQTEIGSTRPWWVGLGADKVIVSTVSGGVASPFLFVDALGVRISPWGLLRRSRQFTGYAQLEDSTVDVQVAAVDEDGEVKLRRVLVEAAGVSFDTIAGLSSANPIEGEGTIDLEIDLNMKEGLEKAQGEVTLAGDGLRISKIAAPAMGLQPQDVDVAVSELDVRLSGDAGVLTVTRGVIRSQLASVDIGGEVTLGDRVDRSRVRLDVEVELGDWEGTPLAPFRVMVDGFTAGAKCDDGRLHYSVNTTLGRFGFNDLHPERCKSSARPSRASPALGEAAGLPNTPPSMTPPVMGSPEAPPAQPERPMPAAVPEEPEPQLDLDPEPENGGEVDPFGEEPPPADDE